MAISDFNITQTDLERFWRIVRKTGDCWAFGKTKAGNYGTFQMRGKPYNAHRISWFIANGPIPEGLCVLHKCDNPPCVNPEHLFLGTQYDNVQDMIRKGRKPGTMRASRPASTRPRRPGWARRGWRKLTKEQVEEIRATEKSLPSLRAHCIPLANRYGVDWTTIRNVLKNQSWQDTH